MGIIFNLLFLKYILKYNPARIEEFINTLFHEFGHVIQSSKKDGYLYGKKNKYVLGLSECEWEKDAPLKIFRGTSINEFAEIINANRISNGNIISETYLGYENFQIEPKLYLYSIGITEEELANLQYKGRNAYIKYIHSKLKSSQTNLSIYYFENDLNKLYNYYTHPNFKSRKRIISVINHLQLLSNDVFIIRFYNILENSKNQLEDFAKLSLDRERKNNELIKLFKKLNISPKELELHGGTSIRNLLLEKGFSEDFIKSFEKEEQKQRLALQEKNEEQSKITYDNSELIEKIYNSFLEYPLSK